MPIYEYQCRDCDHQFEALRKVSDGPPAACPSCGKDALQKLVSKAAFRLKGTGWYETDFKKKSGEKKAADGTDGGEAGKKDAPKKSEATSDSKSETKKPAAKSET